MKYPKKTFLVRNTGEKNIRCVLATTRATPKLSLYNFFKNLKLFLRKTKHTNRKFQYLAQQKLGIETADFGML